MGASLSTEEKELFEALKKGDLEEITRLLDHPKVNVDCVGGGLTPLMYAVRAANVRLVDLLIAKGADIAKTGDPWTNDTALHHAARLNTKFTTSRHGYVPGGEEMNDQGFDGEWFGPDGFKHSVNVAARTVTNSKVGEVFPMLGGTEGHTICVKVANGAESGTIELGMLTWTNGAVWRRKMEPGEEDPERVDDFIMILNALLKNPDDTVNVQGWSKRLMTMTNRRSHEEGSGDNRTTVIEPNSGSTPLHLAARYGHPRIVSLLLDTEGADSALNMRTYNNGLPVHWAAWEGGRADMVEMMLRERPDDIHDSKVSIVRCAVQAGPTEGSEGVQDTSRDEGPGAPCSDTIRLLASKGADLSAADPSFRNRLSGDTPLHFAAKEGWVRIIATLLELGVDVDITQKQGWTPLHYACNLNILPQRMQAESETIGFPGENLVVINTLIGAGANLEALTNGRCCLSQKTPIRLAIKRIPCQSTNHEVVSALIAAGADTTQAQNAKFCCCISLWSQEETDLAVAKHPGPQRQELAD